MKESVPRSSRGLAARHARGALQAARTPPFPPAALPRRSDRRALVVEEDSAIMCLCRDVLENSGFVVDVVDSGIAAVVAARERLPDLILMDSQLRDVASREAIGWLRANPALRSTPIIVLTANADDDADLAAARPGLSLRKPLSPAIIRRTIREILD